MPAPQRICGLAPLRKLLAIVAVLAALCGPAAAQTNLALAKPAAASSSQSGYDVTKGNDGNASSRWAASSSSYPQSWRVDLGSSQTVSKADIYWLNPTSRSYKYRIETSTDDVNYTTRADKTANTTPGNTSDTFSAVSARYVRVTVTGASGGSASFYEMEVYHTGTPAPAINSSLSASGTVGTAFSYQITATNSPTSFSASGLPAGLSVNTTTGFISGTPTTAGGPTNVTLGATNSGGTGNATLALTIAAATTNVSQGKAATASSFQAGNVASNANDGNSTSRWAAADGTFPQWWRVDLGSSTTLSRVDIAWFTSASRYYQYRIEVSTNGSSFTTVVDKTGNTAFGDTSDAFAATARYVRVTVTGASAGFASAHEIQVFGTGSAPSIRIVNAGTKVQSRKRGVSMNALSAADFQVLAPGVSWYYNWGSTPGGSVPPAGVNMTFYPMQWSNTSTTALVNYVASANPKPPVILAINEPNLLGQAFINPQTTASLYAQVKAIGDQHDIPVVGPHMSIGSAPAESITANDPYLGPNYTYTYMEPFINAFLYYAAQAGTSVGATAFHSYGNLGELKYFTELMYNVYGRPVWVTEYAYWNAPNATAARDYLIQATDFLERSPYVAGYAWFKERSSSNTTNISLLVPGQSGVLTTLGTNYVALPPHDSDLYYRIPGRLQAEAYVSIVSADIRATTDSGGEFDLTLSGTPSADYNVQVDTARNYTVQFRATGAGTITLSAGGTTLGTVSTSSSGWQTVSMTVALATGPQTLRVTRSGSVSALNWIEFQ